MPAFITTRDRDAWATIRGYVYQVELTIARWLRLEPGQELELERGEDIDTVQRALISDEEEQSRLLAQIKHREKKLTLRSAEAVEALASFCEHILANPGSKLTFQYITNAKIGRERRSPIPNRTPAVSAWNETSRGELSSEEQGDALTALRALLRKAAKPEGLSDHTWIAFTGFIARATDDDFLDFVRRVEWQTHVGATESLKATIQQILLSNHQASRRDVEPIYQRLFFHVFSLLSLPGIKRLTTLELQAQLALSALSAPERELFDKLKSVLTEIAELDARVTALEDGFERQQQNSKQIESRLQSLTEDLGVSVAVSYESGVPQLDMPILSDHLVNRKGVVSRYLEQLTAKTWIAMYGEIGRGKGYLLRLIAEGRQHPIWIRLDRLDPNRACVRIDQAFSVVSGLRPTAYRQDWFEKVCQELKPGTLIALHEIPRMTGSDALSQRCIMLAHACRSHNIRIVSSSSYNLPAAIIETLGHDVVLSEEAPPFTDKEIRELFEAYGAPEGFLSEKGVEWIGLLTQQNPLLLVAAARYLASSSGISAQTSSRGLCEAPMLSRSMIVRASC